MPRGRTKEILHTADFKKAALRGPRRICHGNRRDHSIPPGSWCFTVKDGLGEKGYCLECARVILERGREKLNDLFAKLERALSDE